MGDPLIRCRISPILSFLAPSIPASWWLAAAYRHTQSTASNRPSYFRSAFHSTADRRADSSSSADLEFLDEFLDELPNPNARRDSDSSRNLSKNINVKSLLDEALKDIPKLQRRKSSDADHESSATLIESEYEKRLRQTPDHYYADLMKFPEVPYKQGTSNRSSPSSAQDSDNNIIQGQRAKRTIRSRPTVGRTIEISPERGIDFAGALRSLDRTCRVNGVRRDLARQRFHERPGMKRKRLKSERWRKLFRESFNATVARVKEMRRKGW